MAQTYLGVDYGQKRWGVAVGDDESRVARPLETIAGDQPEALERLRQLCGDHQAASLVLGLPRGLDGQDTAQTAMVRQVATEWQEVLGVPVVLQDEAVTSELAAERLKQQGASTAGGAIDREAAAIILQDYLEAL